jgi:3-oxoacyl-[acyl-carrier protein] reductase
MASLSDKVVVITGAGGRLGRQIVQRFAKEGATIVAVVLNDEQATNIPFPEDAEGWAFPVDVTDDHLVRACFDQIGQQFPEIHALIHTVGGWEEKPFLETTTQDLDWMVRLNLTSAFLCFREAARLMTGRGGQLIGIASAQGADRGAARQIGYSAAKAGLIRMVESIAEEMRGNGITAHAIAPSRIVYDEDGPGVPVDDIVELCHSLVTSTGAALNGATLRAYG